MEDQPAEGIDLQFVLFQAFIQVYAGNFMDFVKFRPGIGQDYAFFLKQNDRFFLKIIFVFDIADDFFKQVFNRNQPVYAAVFVNDDSHVDFVQLHFMKQVQHPH